MSKNGLTTAGVIATLIAAYPWVTWEKPTIKFYVQKLQNIDPEILQAATLEYTDRPERFPPTAGELKQIAAELVLEARGKLSPGEAWAQVSQQMTKVGGGRYNPPKFSDPNIFEAIERCGGWVKMCDSTNRISERKRFIDAYKAIMYENEKSLRRSPEVQALVDRLSASKQLERGRGLRGLLGRGK